MSRRELLKLSAATAAVPTVWLSSGVARAADPYADARLTDGPPPMPEQGAFTIAVLPDTQNYSQRFPEQFLAQTAWIAEQRKARNIACVLHLGDITNHNNPEGWKNAVKAMNQLDGKVPYFMAVGNHDYSEGGACKDRTTRFNDYFPLKKFRDLPTFGGVYDKEPERFENSYHLFSAGGRDFLVLSLEFGPRADVVRWANEVAAKHKDRAAILITHAYMYSNDTRYDWAKYGSKQSWNPHAYRVAKNSGDDVNDGEELWRELVSRHDNFILTLNGHVLHDGLGRITTATPSGRKIPQLLVNFQMRPKGGDGWLRLLEFRPDGATVQVADYSPTRDQCNRAAENTFKLTIPA
jgi:hypothetical protein